MSDGSLSSISSSPSNSDISADDEPKPLTKSSVKDSDGIIQGNIIHLRKFVVLAAEEPRLDDFCRFDRFIHRIFGSAIGKATSDYSLLLSVAYNNIDKISETPFYYDIILKGICQHDPRFSDTNPLLSTKLIQKIFERILKSHQNKILELPEKEKFCIIGALNWVIWSTQHQLLEVKIEAVLTLIKFVEIYKPTALCDLIIKDICAAGLVKSIYPVKELIPPGKYDIWAHLCNTPFLQSWILSLIDECNSQLHDKIFKFLSLVINYFNDNDKKLVIEASIDCFRDDPDSSHAVDILLESQKGGELPNHFIKKLIKAKTPNYESSQYFKQMVYITKFISALEPSGRAFQYISELLKESIKTIGDLMLYRYCLSTHSSKDKVIISDEKGLPLNSVSKDVLSLNGYILLLNAAYNRNLDINKDNMLFNYFYRLGVELGHTATHPVDYRIIARYQSLMDLDEVLSPAFVTNTDFVDDSQGENEQENKTICDITPVNTELSDQKIIIGECTAMVLAGDIAAARRINWYYNSIRVKHKRPGHYLNEYPKWQVIEFNYQLGYETTITVCSPVLYNEWKRSKLILIYPLVENNKTKCIPPSSIKEQQIIYKVKFEYPVATASPIPGILYIM